VTNAENLPVLTGGRPRMFWNLLFLTSLGAVLCTGPYFWLARIGWVLLAIVCVLDQRYVICSVFFFSAFFHPAGFNTLLPLTIKHFHLAIGLTLVVQTIKNPFLCEFKTSLEQERHFLPILLVLLIGLVNYERFNPGVAALRTPLNLLLVLLMMIYFSKVLGARLLEHGGGILKLGMSFFTFGIFVQLVISFYNLVFSTNVLNLDLLHNNHLGILCAFGIFYGMALEAGERPGMVRMSCLIINVTLIAGIVASCSRTAWFSFLFAFAAFSFLSRRQIVAFSLPKTFRINRRKILFFLLLTSVLLSLVSNTIFRRFYYMPQLLDPNYWNYTVHDHQNFGFLGIYRLNGLHLFHQILLRRPVLGEGFSHQVTDIHGLYFMLTAGAGLAGLGSLLYFFARLLNGLTGVMKERRPDWPPFLEISIFCSLLVWVMSSFMETFVLQFFVWIQPMLAAVVIEFARSAEFKKQSSEGLIQPVPVEPDRNREGETTWSNL